MSWFKRNASPPAETTTPTAAVPQHSRAFEAIVQRLERAVERAERPRVLDLGPAVSRNVDFFTERGCSLQIADLYRSLPPDCRTAEPEIFAAALAAALPDSGAGADLVLAWDLVNYFSPAALVPLGTLLARQTAPDGVLFALLATHKTMPAQPQRYRVLDARTLETAAPEAAEEIQTPRYRQPELERCLPHFRVETTYLLRGGMQEYILLRRRP